MARVAVVTDSTADLPAALRDAAGIAVVPIDVRFGDRTYRDGEDLPAAAFLRHLAAAKAPPTTAPPDPDRFAAHFRRLAADHAGVVAVCLSAKLSGTVRSALVAADMVREIVPVEVVDSRAATMALGFQALRAAALAAGGLDAPTVAARLRAETDRYHLLFMVDSLDHLQRGGRVGRAAALIGGALQLKPLLRVDEGQVVPFERTRTRARAVDELVAFVAGLPRVERLAALSSSDPAAAETLADRLAAAAGRPRAEIVVAQLGPVLAAHTGPDALGVAVFEGPEQAPETDVQRT